MLVPAPDSTRQRILAATAEVLGRNGMTKLSLSHVAPQAGVSRPTLYRWFASKKNLLDAFVVWERQQRVSAVIQLWPCRCRNRRSHALPSFEPNN
jgi:TetR/AcrR family transcriptional regulator, repressor for uid operon